MEVRHIFICPSHNFVGHYGGPPGEEPMQEVDSVECVPGRGLVGDRYFDHKPDYKGQITFFSWEVYEKLCEQLSLHGLKPEAFRRNVIVSGVDLNALIGKEFEVQGVRFLGTEEAKPCLWMNHACANEDAERSLRGHGGLRARILGSGTLKRTAA